MTARHWTVSGKAFKSGAHSTVTVKALDYNAALSRAAFIGLRTFDRVCLITNHAADAAKALEAYRHAHSL